VGTVRRISPGLKEPAPCGGEECGRALIVLRLKLDRALELIAEFHDRTRVLWGAKERYTDSDLWAKAKAELSGK
jgi:hypothetical protein